MPTLASDGPKIWHTAAAPDSLSLLPPQTWLPPHSQLKFKKKYIIIHCYQLVTNHNSCTSNGPSNHRTVDCLKDEIPIGST
jgi:hypothetical protein